MSDREAFVAAIAASPDDDLPRLVFADWLEENGDPERAEFIRTQIAWHHADGDEEKQHLNRRAAELFHEHWARWFGPFLLALDPEDDPAERYQFMPIRDSAKLALLVVHGYQTGGGRAVETLQISRGFVSTIDVMLANLGPRASVAAAFALEPPHILNARLPSLTRCWEAFTHPVLRRVQRLNLRTYTTNGGGPLGLPAVFDDPHLAGVRHFTYDHEDVSSGLSSPVLPAVVALFTRSPLAYRLNGLCLSAVDEEGVRVLCRTNRLLLDELKLEDGLDLSCVRLLNGSGFTDTVSRLTLGPGGLRDLAGAELTRGRWRKLKHLNLADNSLTAAMLPALAAAEFIGRLESLDLSDNPLFSLSGVPNFDTLRELSDALDPVRLVELNLESCRLDSVPDFLAERFGDRVTV